MQAPAAARFRPDPWPTLRLICRDHGGLSYLRSGGDGRVSGNTPPFFRFGDGAGAFAALYFREAAHLYLDCIGIDHSIDIKEWPKQAVTDVAIELLEEVVDA